MQKSPKFKINDLVTFKKPNLYGETEGIITFVEKIFQTVDKFTGKINPRGLVIRESDINNIKIEYRFDGETLEIDYPESVFNLFTQKAHTEKSIFNGYAYTVKSAKMNTILSEKFIKLKK